MGEEACQGRFLTTIAARAKEKLYKIVMKHAAMYGLNTVALGRKKKKKIPEGHDYKTGKAEVV